MDDRLRETLSAMMDDEADELSVRRLLSHPDQHQVQEQWRRWQQIRDVMHPGPASSGRVDAHGLDVIAGVREALDGAALDRASAAASDAPAPARHRWRWSAAALVMLSLGVGFGAGAGWESGDDPVVQDVALKGLDQEQWAQMNRYLLEHAQHNSVGAGRGSMGYARLVSVAGHAY
ncbi:sigma-E factor negative regulatory protein [Marinobacter sp. C2H3]|uniref:sigma-E factor negative regulatory protein n=1 Tax=Marinobacter sp. C2H3 TaxID=3119003 RepID=UPI00300F3087